MEDKLIVTLAGLLFALTTYWFFFGKTEKSVKAENEIDILVDGGYKPDTIEVSSGKKLSLNFFRKDPSSCLEEVVLPDFGKRAYLPLNQTTTIEITPKQKGEYEISCGMNMFHGKIRVI